MKYIVFIFTIFIGGSATYMSPAQEGSGDTPLKRGETIIPPSPLLMKKNYILRFDFSRSKIKCLEKGELSPYASAFKSPSQILLKEIDFSRGKVKDGGKNVEVVTSSAYRFIDVASFPKLKAWIHYGVYEGRVDFVLTTDSIPDAEGGTDDDSGFALCFDEVVFLNEETAQASGGVEIDGERFEISNVRIHFIKKTE